MQNADFILEGTFNILDAGEITCTAPSNIALIKYWGKHGIQLPMNPSLSFTLSNCHTITTLQFRPRTQPAEKVDFNVFFEGEEAPHFYPKIEAFFDRILPYQSFLTQYHFDIDTKNTFPHSSGIASSASGMAALSYALIQLEKKLYAAKPDSYYLRKASFLARLGSGSAARSLEGPICIWGKHPAINDSSDRYAVSSQFSAHPVFKDYQDTILLVDKGEKTVSSSLGHDLMIGHPFANSRFDQAFVNLELLKQAMEKGNLEEFIKIVESEALTLHAMMMTSSPYYVLMKPATLEIIEKVWTFRKKENNHLCFTLDAGANVHLLYPKNEQEDCLRFIKNELAPLCQNEQYILDKTGQGATIVTSKG